MGSYWSVPDRLDAPSCFDRAIEKAVEQFRFVGLGRFGSFGSSSEVFSDHVNNLLPSYWLLVHSESVFGFRGCRMDQKGGATQQMLSLTC